MSEEIKNPNMELSEEELKAISGGDLGLATRAYKLADKYCKACDRASTCRASVAKLTQYIYHGGGDIYAYYRCPYYEDAGRA